MKKVVLSKVDIKDLIEGRESDYLITENMSQSNSIPGLFSISESKLKVHYELVQHKLKKVEKQNEALLKENQILKQSVARTTEILSNFKYLISCLSPKHRLSKPNHFKPEHIKKESSKAHSFFL